MGTISKSLALVLVVLFLASLVSLEVVTVKAQLSTMTSVPATEWQQNYGKDYSALWSMQSVTNLIETNDGGFAFLTIGFARQSWLHPATLYKINSTGNIQWTKQLEHFTASTIIQTSDGGYEIAGNWRTPTAYDLQPTLLKTDSEGNIQWSQNYTSVPQQNINSAIIENDGAAVSTMIGTSDSGYAYVDWSRGAIIKTDQNKQIQWIKNVTYSEQKTIQLDEFSLVVPSISAAMCSLIETSDGALVGLGIALTEGTNVYQCAICLIKTEPFLPLPQKTSLPTPITTPLPTPITTPLPTPITTPTPYQASNFSFGMIPPLFVLLVAITIILLLLFRRHRKTISQNKPNV
jgi:hypothetical protein